MYIEIAQIRLILKKEKYTKSLFLLWKNRVIILYFAVKQVIMESRPLRQNMESGYYLEYIDNKYTRCKISESDADLLKTYISKRIINDHISANNRTSLAVTLIQFRVKFLGDVDYKDVDIDVWDKAVIGLLMSNYKDSSKNAIIKSIRLFFSWCVENGKNTKLTVDDVKAVKFLRLPHKTKTDKDFITQEEIYTMLSYPDISPRVSALVALLYWTGCRIGEILSLKWSDLEFNPPVLEVRVPPFKTNPERYVPTAEALSYLANWRNHYPVEIEGGANGDNYVFVSLFKGVYNRMTAPTAYTLIRKLSDKAIGRKVHPHQFRASDITNKSKAGVSDMTNKMIHWGHVGTNMLEIYSIPSKDMIRGEVMKASGLEDIIEENVDTPVVCPICHKINIGVKFCSNCGSPISRDAVKEKALVDEETARINRENSPVDMLGVVAKELGIEPETALRQILNLLKDKKE